MYGEFPNYPVVFACCDGKYFAQHGDSLVSSASAAGHDVHMHVCNPDADSFSRAALINALTKQRTTFSYSDKDVSGWTNDQIATYYACLRFLILPKLLPHARKVLILDVDSVVMRSFEFPETAVAYFPRPPLTNVPGWQMEGTKLNASAVYFSHDAQTYAEDIAEKISKGELKWYLDQVVLNRVLEKVPRSLVTEYKSDFLDWDFNEGSVIWTGKGNRKYKNKEFIQAKENFRLFKQSLVEYDSVVLKPRLDIPFKKMGLHIVNKKPLQPIRLHWQHFCDQLINSEEEAGKRVLLVEAPCWTFSRPVQSYFKEGTTMFVPHMERHNFMGHDNTRYYMQTVFPEYFTIDPHGWGGGAAFVERYNETDVGDDGGDTFIRFQARISSGESKFAQPASKKLELPSRYIFVPLQIPHDQTIKWHANVSAEYFVRCLCDWIDQRRDEKDPLNIVFKGHPVNLKSMGPLKKIIDSANNAVYLTDASIHDLMAGAEAVYVINSGTGMEAMLHGLPVVNFGRAEYETVTINGSLASLDDVYERVKLDDEQERLARYRRWYNWYINTVCTCTA